MHENISPKFLKVFTKIFLEKIFPIDQTLTQPSPPKKYKKYK